MPDGTTIRDDTAPVFELIAAFGESTDPRLRGNAVYALAALLKREDGAFGHRARSELLRILFGPPEGGETGQRVFVERALDALKALDVADRRSLRDALREQQHGNRDPAQSKWIARLQLTGSEPAVDCFEPGGWWRYLRLTWAAGRPSFWANMWAATWRTTVVWSPLLAGLMFFEVPSEAAILWPWTALCMGLLASISLAGRIAPPNRVRWADTAVCAALFGLLAIGAEAVLPEMLGHPSAGTLVPLAVATSALVRWLRWLSVSTSIEPSGLPPLLRPASAFLSVSLACALWAQLGGEGRHAMAAWLLLAPAGSVAAWLDIYLDRHGTGAQLPRLRTRREWLLPSIASAAAGLVLLVAANQVRVAGGEHGAVSLPGGLSASGAVVISTRLNALTPIDVQEDGFYAITGGGRARANSLSIERDGMDHVLVVFDHRQESLDSADSPEPPTLKRALTKGRYFVCIADRSERRCSTDTPGTASPRGWWTSLEAALQLAISGPRTLLIQRTTPPPVIEPAR